MVNTLFSTNPIAYGSLRASLGDVGSPPGWNTIDIQGVTFLVGSAFNPKPVGGSVEDGPDLLQVDNTVISILMKAVADAITTIESVASASISEGDIVSFTEDGRIRRADANSILSARTPVGISISDGSPGDVLRIFSANGKIVSLNMDSPAPNTSGGNLVYLSTSAGKGTLTPPNNIGSRVFVIGVMKDSDGISDKSNVMWNPHFVEDL